MGFWDRRIQTLEYVRSRCSFLLTVILHTAARHATSSLVPRAPTITRVLDRHLHSTLWPRVLVENKKNVHICQACMLWATLVSQPENGQENMGWTLFGHASESRSIRGHLTSLLAASGDRG